MSRGTPPHVVIATKDRRDTLMRTLSSLHALPDRGGITVADNGSTDGTATAVASSFPEVRVIPLEENLGAAARTVAAATVEAEVIAFVDDDSWWAPGSLALAAEMFARHPSLGLVAARILVGEDHRLDPTSAAMRASPLWRDDDLPGVPILGFLCCGALVRRRAFLEAGGFHARLGIGGEERLLAMDLAARGWSLRYVEDVVAHHHPSRTRNEDRRRHNLTRNEIWSTWLRRPAGPAMRATAAAVRRAATDPPSRAAIIDAARGWRWVLRHRRLLPPDVERDVRLLETV